MSTKPYFCYAPTDDTMIFYDTAEEARGAALHAIEDASDGEWHPEVGGICWGRVHESAEVDIQHEHGPECQTPEDGFDCPYGLSRDYDYGGEVKLVAHAAPQPPPLPARLAAAEAEVERLRILGPDTASRVTIEAREVASTMLRPVSDAWRAEVAKVTARAEAAAAEVARLRAELAEAQRDADVLAELENERLTTDEGSTPYPALEAVKGESREVFDALQRAAERRAGGAG